MSAIVLNEKFEKASELALPESFSGINPHNLYLYVKSYQASLRADTASAKTRADVRGGGKPWAKGRGGGVPVHAVHSMGWRCGRNDRTGRNTIRKVNKKQKKLR